MICLELKFPAGRYHATPWGRHVNEGDVAWPPEPYRILRALIATWHRKADKTAYTYERLGALIDALSEADPQFHLPDCVHAHTRHYMPQGKLKDGRESTKLVIDAFLRLNPDDPLLIGWDIALPSSDFELLEHLADNLGYFGRAESLVTATILSEWPSDSELNLNVFPLKIDENGFTCDTPDGLETIDVLAPVQASQWPQHREQLLLLNSDNPKSKTRRIFEATIPERLVDAVSVDTGDIQSAKWSAAPAGRYVLYARPPLSPTPAGKRRGISKPNKDLPTVARFVLAGKPRPSVFETVKIAETMRLATMSRWRGMRPPAYISGRDEKGAPLRDAEHLHAFWLPEDADGDGLIDHVIVYAEHGFEDKAQRKLGRLTRLWIEHGAPDEDGDRGRSEWRLALEGFGSLAEFQECSLLRDSTIWRSTTPYLRPRFGPRTFEETEAQIRYELEARGFCAPVKISPIGDFQRPCIAIRQEDQVCEPIIKFRRTRTRRGLVQPDTYGSAVKIEFPSIIAGPLALGFGAHFGLGLFKAADAA